LRLWERYIIDRYSDFRPQGIVLAGMDQKHAIAALGALAQETRLDLFRLLGLPAGVIAERLGVQPSSLSYSAEYGAMTELLAYLTENCCGRGEVCVPACDPADAFTKGESNEAPARARVR
jgi:ArsR family transcriptional regulator, arsenate/arsenite/antimonite-responsive transcriptional repressor